MEKKVLKTMKLVSCFVWPLNLCFIGHSSSYRDMTMIPFGHPLAKANVPLNKKELTSKLFQTENIDKQNLPDPYFDNVISPLMAPPASDSSCDEAGEEEEFEDETLSNQPPVGSLPRALSPLLDDQALKKNKNICPKSSSCDALFPAKQEGPDNKQNLSVFKKIQNADDLKIFFQINPYWAIISSKEQSNPNGASTNKKSMVELINCYAEKYALSSCTEALGFFEGDQEISFILAARNLEHLKKVMEKLSRIYSQNSVILCDNTKCHTEEEAEEEEMEEEEADTFMNSIKIHAELCQIDQDGWTILKSFSKLKILNGEPTGDCTGISCQDGTWKWIKIS